MTSPRPPSSWSPSPPERRSSDHSPCTLTYTLGPHWPWELGHSDTNPHPNRAAGASALSAATLPWQPGALVPAPLKPPRMRRWGGRSFCPPYSMHLPLYIASPPLLACRGLYGITPSPLPSRAPSVKGQMGTLQVGWLPLHASHPREPVQPYWGLSGGIPFLCT